MSLCHHVCKRKVSLLQIYETTNITNSNLTYSSLKPEKVTGNKLAYQTQEPKPLRIAIITDAWTPQTNGVVRTLGKVGEELSKLGHAIEFITPNRFPTIVNPFYPEIHLAYWTEKLKDMIKRVDPNAIHIATEGPVGLASRAYAINHGLPFTTSYHTKFPEFLYELFKVPKDFTYAYLKWFHRKASSIMVPTETVKKELEIKGFKNVKLWSRGVDLNLFQPMTRREKEIFLPYKHPTFLNVGRVSQEKNLKAFLNIDLPGTKIVVGDGPQLNKLRQKYPNVVFTGAKHGEELAKYYAASDVFVFPSLTDTFGLVMAEALASGIPVAAFPVTGPIDVVGKSKVGFLNNNLQTACLDALHFLESGFVTARDCREYVVNNYSWTNTAKLFYGYLHPFFSRSERKKLSLK